MAVVAVCHLPLIGFSLGFRIPNQDAEAIARGNAFVATADNPSALYYNAAGLTQLEGEMVQVGYHLLSVNSEYDSFGGRHGETKFEVLPVPQLYFTCSPKDSPFSYGLGIYAPFGLGLKWQEPSPFRTLAIEGRMTYVTLHPALAWEIHPTLSLGVGPTLNYSKVQIRQGIVSSNDEFQFHGDDFAFGGTLGLLWKPHRQWSVGVSYRSATTMNYRGDLELRPYAKAVTASAELDFPQIVTAGVSFRPTDQWNIEINVDWTDWDSLNTVTFKRAPSDIPFALNWKSSFLYELGVTRKLDRGYFISAGYFFSENSTSEQNFSPLVPDTDLHVGSLGFGRKGRRWDWAVSGQIITGPSRRVASAQSTSLAGETANGRYQWFNQALNLSVAYKF